MALMVRCVLYPGAKLFVTSGGKEQAASILHDKVNEICSLIPAFRKEIYWGKGKSVEGKDKVRYKFKNGSELDNIAAKESSRGLRRHGGAIEESVGVDGKILQEVIIPIMAIARRAADGSVHQEETVNKCQVHITTAGWKNTFPYNKLISFLVRMITQPNRCIILGGTWRTPVAVGLQSKTFIKDQKEEGTYNEASFEREYESIWSGTVEDAFFNGEHFDRARIINLPEEEYNAKAVKGGGYYIISVDVGRKGCDSVVCVFFVAPQAQGTSIKKLVNIYTFSDEHFEDQAIKLKKLFYKFKAKRMVIDANGLGIGLIDYMIKTQIDQETGDTYVDFGIYNDKDNYYKKYQTKYCEYDAIYLVKADAPFNTEAHTNVQTQLSTGKVKMLIDEKIARMKLVNTRVGQAMRPEERKEYLKPFVLTTILKEEMMNLREDKEGLNIVLKRVNTGIKKDKFSSFEYGLYYIKLEEESKKKKRFSAKDFMFISR